MLATLTPIAGDDFIHDGDETTIGVPIDFLGINYYMPTIVGTGVPETTGTTGTTDRSVAASEPPTREPAWVGLDDVAKVDSGRPKTAMGWEIDADGMFDMLTRVTADYDPPPLYITENGAAFADEMTIEG